MWSDSVHRSTVYNKLSEKPRHTILTYFFDHLIREQEANEVLKVLLKQLLQQFELLSPALLDECLNEKNKGSKVGGDTLLKLWKMAVSEFYKNSANPIFILVDAYDEFLNKVNKQQAERRRFRGYIKAINETGRAAILITTRDHLEDELRDSFESRVIKMQADGDDIDKFLDKKVDPMDLIPDNKAYIKKKIKQVNVEKW